MFSISPYYSRSTYFTLSFLLFSIFFVSSAHAQTGSIKGNILEFSNKMPIEFMPIRLYVAEDSSVVGNYYTDQLGNFEITGLPLQSYNLVIRTFFNFEAKYFTNLSLNATNSSLDLGKILMKPVDSEELEEVVIQQEKKLIETSFDKKVYNVENDMATKGGTVSDVLNNIPSIEVDQDGKVSLRGDGNVTILIDGRPSTLTGTNGKSLFDALPAGSIERIEVVNNPSAKYDPDGTSGIINIVLKKNKLRGINGNIALSAGTGNTYNGSASISFRNSKVNAFATYAFRYYEGQRINEIRLKRNYADSLLERHQDRIGTDLMINHTLRVGSDFTFKPRHLIGFAVTGNIGSRERTGDLQNAQWDDMQEVRTWERLSKDPSSNTAFDVNLNYKYDLKDEKGSLTADISQSFSEDKAKGFYDERSLMDYGVPSVNPELHQRLQNADNARFTTAQVDFTKKFTPKRTLDIGTKAIIRHSLMDATSQTENNATQEFSQDTLSTYQYQYDEQIYSLYGNYAEQIKKFKYQVGVRLESALQAPNLLSENNSLSKQYYNAYPSGLIGYSLTEKSDIALSFSRRINRPQSDQLNPFTSYADPLNLRAGNPHLTPEYINSLELGYNIDLKKVNFSANVFYRQTKDMIQRINVFQDNGVTISTQANIDNSNSLGTDLVAVYKPFVWWRNVLSFNANYIEFIDHSTTSNWNNTGFNWGFKYAGTFDFWKKTASLQLNARYRGKMITPQGTATPRMVIDLSGQKSLKNGNWNIGFRITDVFNKQQFVIEVEQPSIYQYSRFKQNTRRFYLTLTYKFGKYDVSKKSKITSSGGEDE